jgi:NAD(P)-dependent dehydrogenase (short-subunit alcohol dehydrogenase family)
LEQQQHAYSFQKEPKVVLVDLNEEKGKAFEAELKALNAIALFIKANITSEEEVVNIFKQTIETFGKVDVVFNNAGIGRVHPSHELEYSEWRKTVNVDLDGVFLVARESIREMRLLIRHLCMVLWGLLVQQPITLQKVV